MNSSNDYLTTYGCMLSFSSGFLIPLGLQLLSTNPFSEYSNKNLNKTNVIILLLNGLGGGCLAFGIYLLCPSSIRRLWYF